MGAGNCVILLITVPSLKPLRSLFKARIATDMNTDIDRVNYSVTLPNKTKPKNKGLSQVWCPALVIPTLDS